MEDIFHLEWKISTITIGRYCFFAYICTIITKGEAMLRQNQIAQVIDIQEISKRQIISLILASLDEKFISIITHFFISDSTIKARPLMIVE
jgi:hypothetical protein